MDSSLSLPVGDRTYVVPSPPAGVGLALQAAWVIQASRRAGKTPPAYAVERYARYDDGTHELDQDALGPAWDAMIADGVDLVTLRRAAMAAYTWICTGNSAAALTYFGGEAETASGPKASTTTAAATTTKRRASTTGTTSRKAKSTG